MTFEILVRIVAVGIGATAIMDIWLLALKQAGVPVQGFAPLGRWIGHWAQGQWRHDAIAKAAPVRRETMLGWLAHYAIGIGFAALLVAACGARWLQAPSLYPALLTGIVTVAAPLLVMQPAMGAGIASSRTRTPLRNSIKSLANHTVFGLGLYLATKAIQQV